MSVVVRIALACLTVLVVTRPTFAQPCVEPRPTTIVVGNGMFNTPEDAMSSYRDLKALVSPSIPASGEEEWSFEIAYNESEPFLRQLFQVANQRVAADVASFWRMLGGITPLPTWFQDALRSLSTELELAPFEDDADLAMHVARYRELMLRGSKVVLVAHSQGNLYANAAYDALFERENPVHPEAFGIVSVATPADHVAGKTLFMPYTTLEEDRVISAVRAVFPETLAANVSAMAEEIEPMGHGFGPAYLRASASRGKILNDVLTMQVLLPRATPDGVVQPPSSAGCSDAQTQPTVECSSSNWEGTCWATFFDPCWDPVGMCDATLEVVGRTVVTRLNFPNGAHSESSIDASDLENLPKSVVSQFVSSSGQTCGEMQIWTGLGPACVARTVATSAKGTLTFCVDERGTAHGVCPDGSAFRYVAAPACSLVMADATCAAF